MAVGRSFYVGDYCLYGYSAVVEMHSKAASSHRSCCNRSSFSTYFPATSPNGAHSCFWRNAVHLFLALSSMSSFCASVDLLMLTTISRLMCHERDEK